MRVIVVGATGHIGTYLVPKLWAEGHEVVAISRGERSPYRDDPAWGAVEHVQLDRPALDAEGEFGARVAALHPDAVIDLICFELSSAQQLAAALAPLRCYLLHCGTIWAHGPGVEVPATEDAPRRPFGSYGTKKAQIEEFLLGEARRGALACTVLHPGHISGPGWVPVGPAGNLNLEIFSRLATGQEVALPNFGLETVHHVHADDVAQAFVAALQRPEAASGEAFHVVSERAVTLRGYCEKVASWSGQAANLKFMPWEEWAAAALPDDVATTYDHIAHSPCMSIEKAKRSIGYSPRYTSLETVFEALSWLVAHGRIPGLANGGTLSWTS